MLDRWLTRGHDPDDPDARSQLVAAAGEDLTDLARRLADSFLGRCVRRFVDMTGIDRSMVLASQAFTSMIPLLILVATWAPAGKENVIAESVIRKFHLEGDAASAVTQLFAVPEGATGSVSTFSALLLVISGTSFTRRFQRMYRAAYEQQKAGIRSGVYSTLGLFVLLLEVFVLYGARALVAYLPLSWLFTLPFAVVTGVILWTSIPYLLLNRQVHWRRLVFGGVVAAVATAVYSVASTIYMPEHGGALHPGVRPVRGHHRPDRLAPGDRVHPGRLRRDRRRVRRCLAPWAMPQDEVQAGGPRPRPPGAHRGRPLGRDDHGRHPARDPGRRQLGDPDRGGLGRHGRGAGDQRARRFLGVRRRLAAAGPGQCPARRLPRVLPVPQPVLVVAVVSLLVNGLLLIVVAWLSPGLEIDNFGAAMLGGLVIAAVTTALEVLWKPIRRHL